MKRYCVGYSVPESIAPPVLKTFLKRFVITRKSGHYCPISGMALLLRLTAATRYAPEGGSALGGGGGRRANREWVNEKKREIITTRPLFDTELVVSFSASCTISRLRWIGSRRSARRELDQTSRARYIFAYQKREPDLSVAIARYDSERVIRVINTSSGFYTRMYIRMYACVYVHTCILVGHRLVLINAGREAAGSSPRGRGAARARRKPLQRSSSLYKRGVVALATPRPGTRPIKSPDFDASLGRGMHIGLSDRIRVRIREIVIPGKSEIPRDTRRGADRDTRR